MVVESMGGGNAGADQMMPYGDDALYGKELRDALDDRIFDPLHGERDTLRRQDALARLHVDDLPQHELSERDR